jgi:hypothetical protein
MRGWEAGNVSRRWKKIKRRWRSNEKSKRRGIGKEIIETMGGRVGLWLSIQDIAHMLSPGEDEQW